MKYKFFRHLLSAKQAVIFSLKSETDNIAVSSFVEELKLQYNLKNKEVKLNDGAYPQLIKRIFNLNTDLLELDLNSTSYYSKQLEIAADDFKEQSLSLSYYKYSCLKECSYKFYLRHLARLEPGEVEFSKKISKKVLGILVHKVFAEIVNNNNFEVNRAVIKQFLEEVVESFALKIPRDYQKYYETVMFTAIEEAIAYFFDKVTDNVNGEIKNLLPEWAPARKNREAFLTSKDFTVYLSGRIDLVIEAESSNHLIDYKTGSGDTEQLDFYELLYNPESAGEERVVKSIYQVMEQRFKRSRGSSKEKFAKELLELIKEELLDSEQYLAELKSQCRKCNYPDICRVGLR